MSLLGVMLLAALALGSSMPAQTVAPREALDGIDPVLLIQGHEVAGKPELKVIRGRFEYLFATADTKAIFEREPEKYEIQLGGLCARMGGAAATSRNGGDPLSRGLGRGQVGERERQAKTARLRQR